MTIVLEKDWKQINPERIRNIQDNLVEWYEKNQRKLPWRETKDPYYIWISEVMLQQTRVDTVIPYFQGFIQKFPTVESLAKAHEEEILKAWEGLGYYSRARNLQRGAQVVLQQYEGEIPQSIEEIQKIPGVGPYTAGAILSIAYGKAVPAVDGNAMRVFSRIFCITGDIGEGKTRKEMEEIGGMVVSKENPSFFNQGLMELGALICTPLSPKCMACPLYQECCAAQQGIQQELPIKKKKQKIKEMDMEVALFYKEDKLLLLKRPADGLLSNLWGLPVIEKEDAWAPGESILQELKDTLGMETTKGEHLLDVQHVFTHVKWKMKVYRFSLKKERAIEYPQIQWVTLDEIKEYAVPTAFLKILKNIKNK